MTIAALAAKMGPERFKAFMEKLTPRAQRAVLHSIASLDDVEVPKPAPAPTKAIKVQENASGEKV